MKKCTHISTPQIIRKMQLYPKDVGPAFYKNAKVLIIYSRMDPLLIGYLVVDFVSSKRSSLVINFYCICYVFFFCFFMNIVAIIYCQIGVKSSNNYRHY